MRILALGLVALLLLSGCSGSKSSDSSTTGPSSGTDGGSGGGDGGGSGTGSGGGGGGSGTGSGGGSGTGSGGGSGTNTPPSGSLQASAVSGVAPLAVSFTIDGADADGDDLAYAVDANGDGTPDTVVEAPATLPATFNFTYDTAGSFNATLALTDGTDVVTFNVTIDVSGPIGGNPQPDQAVDGSVTCIPSPPPYLIGGALADGEHNIDVLNGNSRMTITLSYADISMVGLVDIDMYITDPDGTVTESIAGGPEPPAVFEAPTPGQWTIVVSGFSCAGSADYSLDITFD